MDERYDIKDSEYREGFNKCYYFIKQIAALTEKQLLEIYGHSVLSVIFEDEAIDNIVNKYLNWLSDFHVGDEVELVGSDKCDKYVIVHSNNSTCTLLNKAGTLTSYPKEHLTKTGISYPSLQSTLEALGK